MSYTPLGSGTAYDENPENQNELQERTPLVSGIEALLARLRQPLQLPMLPPGPPVAASMAGPPAPPAPTSRY